MNNQHMIFKIDVQLYPNNEIEDDLPYFWCLQSNTGGDWCTENAGWADTPEHAWQAAYNFYSKYYSEVNT